MQHGTQQETGVDMQVNIDKLIMKIVHVDYEQKVMEVKFSSTNSRSNIDDMPSTVFQFALFPEVDNVTEFMKRVAVAGFSIAVQQLQNEMIEEYPVSKLNFDQLLNREVHITPQEAFNNSAMQSVGYYKEEQP